jgi:heptosyltransferase-2
LEKSITTELSGNWLINSLVQLIFDITLKIIRTIYKVFSKNGNSVCVISIHKLGDSIFTFNTINSIKKFYNKDVYILCHYNAKEIYNLIHPENLIIPIPKECFHFNDRYLNSKARKLLNSLNPEIIIDLTGVMTSVSLIFNSKAKKIIGMNRKLFRSIFDDFVEVNMNLNSLEIYNNAIKNFIPACPIEIKYDELKTSVKRILIFPFAGWKSKEWGLGKFIRLAERIKDDYEVEFVFDNTFISNEIYNYLHEKDIKYSITETVKDLIDKINSTDLVIGNDSGPAQIAAFLGKRTFSIYGPTNPIFHLVIGKRNKFIQKKLSCSPKENERLCFTDGGKSGCPSFECMNLLTVDEVFTYLKSEVL